MKKIIAFFILGPLGLLLPGLRSTKATSKGVVMVLPSAILTPSNIFPFDSLSVITNVKEASNRIPLIILAVFLGLIEIYLLYKVFVSSYSNIFYFLFLTGILFWIVRKIMKTPRVGLKLEASSGAMEIIVSQDKDFIVELRRKILIALNLKSQRIEQFFIDKSSHTSISVKGDGAFNTGKFTKIIETDLKEGGPLS